MRYFGPYDTSRRPAPGGSTDYQAKALSALGDIEWCSAASPSSRAPPRGQRRGRRHGDLQHVSNVLGWPAGVIPFTRVRAGEGSQRPVNRDPHDVAARETERAAEGMPIGVQLAARPWRDHVALAAMAALEKEARGRDGYPATPVYLL